MSSSTVAVRQQTPALQGSPSRIGDRTFFTGMAIAFLVIALLGFGPSYFFRPLTSQPPLSPILHVHGAIFTGWLMLLVLQTGLIAAGKRALHRKLGFAGAVLAIAMVVVGTATAIIRVREGALPPAGMSPLAFLAVPLLSIWTFAVLMAFAVYKRSHADVHKRVILLTTIDILGAATARLAGMTGAGMAGFLGFPILLIVILGVYDYRSRGRIHPVTLWIGGFIAAMQPLRLVIGNTDAWQTFAGWLVG